MGVLTAVESAQKILATPTSGGYAPLLATPTVPKVILVQDRGEIATFRPS